MFRYAIDVSKKEEDGIRYNVSYESEIPLGEGDNIRLRGLGEEGNENDPLRDDVVKVTNIGHDSKLVGEVTLRSGLVRKLFRSTMISVDAEIVDSYRD